MPTASQHRTKAEGSRRFLSTIDRAAHADWAAVVAFYTAVHLVERMRADDDRLAAAFRHSNDHYDRLGHVQSNHRTIHDEFRQLWNVSKIARYESNARFYDQFSNEDVGQVLTGRWLVAIEGYVAQTLGG